MICAGSVRLIERLTAEGKIDPRSSSGAADEGTAAHQVRGDALELGLDAYDFIGTKLTINGVAYECDHGMAEHLQPGMDWVREQPGEMIVEHRVDLSRWMPGQFGTLDTGVIDRVGRRAIISDLKYGAGVPVDALENRQMRIYALGALDNFDALDDVDTLLLNIDQPRAGGMKFWEISITDLLAFGEEVRIAAERVDDPDASFVATEKGCKWCPVKDTLDGCPAYDTWMNEIVDHAFDEFADLDVEPVFRNPATMDPARRAYIVMHSHLATKWFAKLHEDCLNAAVNGQPDPGTKAVMGRRGNRRFTDATKAAEIAHAALGDEAFTRSLKSLTDLEKDLAPKRGKPGDPAAWASLSALITQSDGKPILVPASDERPAVQSLDDKFNDF